MDEFEKDLQQIWLTMSLNTNINKDAYLITIRSGRSSLNILYKEWNLSLLQLPDTSNKPHIKIKKWN